MVLIPMGSPVTVLSRIRMRIAKLHRCIQHHLPCQRHACCHMHADCMTCDVMLITILGCYIKTYKTRRFSDVGVRVVACSAFSSTL